MTHVESSNIYAIGYNGESSILYVEFKSGSTYAYFDVPKNLYISFMQASSHGKFFWQYIRKGGFNYERLPSSEIYTKPHLAPDISSMSNIFSTPNIIDDKIQNIKVTNNSQMDNESVFAIGKAYLYGEGLPKSIEKALRCFKLSADNGYVDAQLLIAEVFQDIIGDIQMALAYLKLASQAGKKEASWKIAMIFYSEKYGTKNNPLYRYWIEIAAKQGHWRAQELLNLYARPARCTVTYCNHPDYCEEDEEDEYDEEDEES